MILPYNVCSTLEELIQSPNSIYTVESEDGDPIQIAHDSQAAVGRELYPFPVVRQGIAIPNTDLLPEYLRDLNHVSEIPSLDMSELQVLDDPHFYFFFPWGGNYQHFMADLLPRLASYHKLKKLVPNLKLYVSEYKYHHDFLYQLGVSRDELTIHNSAVPGIIFNSLFSSSPCSRALGKISTTALKIYESLRRIEVTPDNRGELVFLDRNSSTAGRDRAMTNRAALHSYLTTLGFKTVALEDMSFREKKAALDFAKLIVTPIGSNLMNIVLAQGLSKIVVINHPRWRLCPWYKDLLLQSGDNVEVLAFNECAVEIEGSQAANQPFSVDLDKFKVALEEFM